MAYIICKIVLEKLRVLQYEMLVTDFVGRIGDYSGKAKQGAQKALALIDGSIGTQLRSRRPLHLPALFLAKGLAFVCGETRQNELAQECFERSDDAGRAPSRAFVRVARRIATRAALDRLWSN